MYCDLFRNLWLELLLETAMPKFETKIQMSSIMEVELSCVSEISDSSSIVLRVLSSSSAKEHLQEGPEGSGCWSPVHTLSNLACKLDRKL